MTRPGGTAVPETRSAVVGAVARHLAAIARPHPVRVGIDGVDAAGKTTLADDLVAPLEALGRPVIRASVDAFLQPAAVRYQRGRMSPEGYFRDSIDVAAIKRALLLPLGPGGTRQYQRVVFDVLADTPVESPAELAETDAILLVDGVFLQSEQLVASWDCVIFVRASFEITLARAEVRDRVRFGGLEEMRRRYRERYVPGQQLYLVECQPERRATIVIDNTDPAVPLICRGPGTLRCA